MFGLAVYSSIAYSLQKLFKIDGLRENRIRLFVYTELQKLDKIWYWCTTLKSSRQSFNISSFWYPKYKKLKQTISI
jgi:hypothetical protein